MNPFRFSFWVFVFGLCCLVRVWGFQWGSGTHMADVNILLPPKMTYPVEYRLQGSDGCFKWSWDHHDVLSVVPEYNETNRCSASARLRSIAPYTGRKETAVYAADVRTGIVIRCKVYIDLFSRIQIFHNSIKLDLDGLATLRVRAFDREDNVFSSLVGLQFMWKLMPESDVSRHHLVYVPLKDSPLSDCGGFCGDLDIQIKLEHSGVFSDVFVVKGTEIGHEKVSVHLVEPHFSDMEDKIALTVAEAMSLYPPSPVFVLVGASLQYTLKVIRGNVPQVVALPSPFHRWSALNSSIARVDASMGLAQALNLGETSVIVEDTRVAGNVHISSFHVVLPDSIFLYLMPLSKSGDPFEEIKAIPSTARWYVISGRQYVIELKVFSRGPDANEVYLAGNEDVKLLYDQSEYWRSFPVSDSIAFKYGWQNARVLHSLSQGRGKLSVSLAYSAGHPVTTEVLKLVQEVTVCDRVEFILDRRTTGSSTILLPWVPDVYQEVELKAVGGCAKTPGDYKWFSSDMDIVYVSAAGVVQAKKAGKATVRVVSTFDALNFDEVSIEVALPSSLVMLPYFPVETVVGSHLQAAVTMKASNGEYFYRCNAFISLVKWTTGSELFIVNSTREASSMNELEIAEKYRSFYGPPCAWTSLYATNPGRAVLQATLSKHVDHNLGGPVILKASAPIASYSPLIAHQAGDGNHFGGYWFDLGKAGTGDELDRLDDLYLAPRTHLDVKLVGGPVRWGEGVDFIEVVDIFDEHHTLPKDGAIVDQIDNDYGPAYRISCQSLGNFTFLFKRGNLVGDDHPQPVVAEVRLQLACSLPSSIVVLADESANKLDTIKAAVQADRGPGRIRTMPITVANGRTIRVSAVGIGRNGKVFANSSSIPLSWELGNCDELAYWDDAYNVEVSTSSWERFLALRNASGLCTIRGTVRDFHSVMDGRPPSLESYDHILTDAIRLQVVSTLRMSPAFNLLFFNPDAKMNLTVIGGSCFLDAVVNDSRVIEVVQPVPGLQCSHLTVVPRGLGTSIVTVYDVGLSPPLTASSVIRVADVDWIKIISGEEIGIMEGNLQSIDILAGVDDGITFDSSQFSCMNIHVHVEDHIVDLVDADGLLTPDGLVSSSNFTIYARRRGITTIYVSVKRHSGYEILSQPVNVEVYAPPVMHPNEIFLVPGASSVITVRGGPTIGAFLEYSSVNDSAATIHESSGRLNAVSPGNSTIVATFYGSGRTLLCQAHGKAKVGVPSSAILNVQSQQLSVGREMPVFPSLLEGDLFSFYELCHDYKWTVEDEKVLSFRDDEHVHAAGYKLSHSRESIYTDERDIDFIKVLYGRSAGKTNVALTFSCNFASPGSSLHSRSYSTSVSISVVPDPPLALGVPVTWILPPHYISSDLLPLVSAWHSTQDSQSQKRTVTYSVLGNCGGTNENSAISIDGRKVRTVDSYNLACIQAKDHATGRIEVASCVRVAEVAQIRMGKKLGFHVINLAVGAELELPINYYDDLGNPFHEAHNMIVFEVETNYCDILAVNATYSGNGIITIKALRHGEALVRVRFHDLQKSDYVMVSVGAHIHPQNPVLHPGSYMNFSIEGHDEQGSGQWLSANRSVISLDSQSGKALAVGEGTSTVTFRSPSLKLQTTVKVLKGNAIFVDAPKDTLTNIPFLPGGYNFSVKFSGHNIKAPGRNVEVPYECKVEPSYLGYAKPWRDLDTGDSYCLFFPYSPKHLAHSTQKPKDMGKDISVSIHAFLSDDNDVSGSASSLFIGGFSILEMDKEPWQLNLKPKSNRSIITIVGNTDVVIHWKNRDVLTVSELHKDSSGVAGHVQYEIKVLKAVPFEEKLIFTLPTTGERVEVEVKYEPGERPTPTSALVTTMWAGLIGCVALVITVIIFMYILDKPERSPPSIPHPGTSTVAPPRTPDRPSSTVVNELSPRTPSPFVEYVRRTIDETPYYRREARRFNPQNTY